MAVQSTDRRRLKGMRTRQSILGHAARVGSAEGLEAVSPRRLQRAVGEAQAAGEIDPAVDAEQLSWELDSLLGGANSGFKGGDGPKAIERGRRAIRDRLTSAATPTAPPLTF